MSENQPSRPDTPPPAPDSAGVVPPEVYAPPADQAAEPGGSPVSHPGPPDSHAGGWASQAGPPAAQAGGWASHAGPPASHAGAWASHAGPPVSAGGTFVRAGGPPVTMAAQLAPHVTPAYGRPPDGFVPSPGRPPSGLFPGPSRPIFREPHPVAAAPVLAGFGAALLWLALFGGLAHDLAAYAWWTIVAAITAWAVAIVLTVLGDRGAAVGVALASGLGLSIAMAFVGTRWIDTYDWPLW